MPAAADAFAVAFFTVDPLRRMSSHDQCISFHFIALHCTETWEQPTVCRSGTAQCIQAANLHCLAKLHQCLRHAALLTRPAVRHTVRHYLHAWGCPLLLVTQLHGALLQPLTTVFPTVSI